MAELKITTIYDNYEHDPRLQTGWGFSCLVEVGDRRILFDTGADRAVELRNIEQLGIDLGQVEAIFLSHAHGDHTGGLSGVLEAASGPKVYLGRSFPRSLKDGVRRYGAEPVEVTGPMELFENIYSTGELGTMIKEQSMIVKIKKGLVVITGCAHPGVVNIVRSAKEQLDGEIHLILGGFHLSGMSDSQVSSIIDSLKELEVEKASPCHCTGERAIELFKEAYEEDFIANGVGNVIEI